mmetsp:Transcript_25545/g.70547  ORF Transcript_25545/g.70547 Transcript_25545/m.70547 type:complete len:107 (+) Transcript_25545:85-405(+)|eukprot:CAMPEP_0168744334 /NCGR_PEP_ID=MMETSP0724-20121128/14038_1 /TAXON_ID=265536 /ORGANISM="Amphiprora sp., Strain CCMP467" /LENGTH=106 /DNA_ID=CAMNT_0008791991 /DNA_START=46 /DNA_END=366 /DNA_ORIENTATION=+
MPQIEFPLGKTEYPIVNNDPSVGDAFSSARISDYFFVAGVTGGSWALGFLRGRPIRHTAAGIMMTVGFTFSTFYVLQSCRDRLLGSVPNGPEVKYYEKLKAKALAS